MEMRFKLWYIFINNIILFYLLFINSIDDAQGNRKSSRVHFHFLPKISEGDFRTVIYVS